MYYSIVDIVFCVFCYIGEKKKTVVFKRYGVSIKMEIIRRFKYLKIIYIIFFINLYFYFKFRLFCLWLVSINLV